MRAVLPVALILVLVGRSLAEGTATDLASQLLRRLGAEEAAALKQTPPANDRAMTLRSAAETLRRHLGGDHAANPVETRADGEVAHLRGLLGDFPELVKLAEQWDKARVEEDRAWDKAACAEMEKVGNAAVAKIRAAQTPADIDAAIADLTQMAHKYPYDRNNTTWLAWEGCARGITGLLAFTNEVRAVLAAEQDGQRREGLDRLAALFRREEAPLVSPADLQALRNEHARKLGLPSTDEAEDAVRATIAKAIAATKPAELDSLLEQLNRAQKLWVDIRSGDQQTRTLSRLTEVGREFVVKWQDYMVDRASGEISRARSVIQSLARTAESEPVYPRAQLLETAAALAAAPATPPSAEGAGSAVLDRVFAKVKTLDDLAAQLPEIQAALKNATGESHTIGIDLERIEEAYVRLRAGDLNTAKMTTFGGFNKHPKVAELRVQLALRMAAAALHGEGALAPRADEKLNEYITRLVADAQQRKDWRRLQEIYETTFLYPALSGILNQGDTFAVRTFLSARNLDAAGVWPSAVASYIRVLNIGSPLVPTEEVKQRIDAIRREHPEDYQRGSDQASAPIPPPSR